MFPLSRTSTITTRINHFDAKRGAGTSSGACQESAVQNLVAYRNNPLVTRTGRSAAGAAAREETAALRKPALGSQSGLRRSSSQRGKHAVQAPAHLACDLRDLGFAHEFHHRERIHDLNRGSAGFLTNDHVAR